MIWCTGCRPVASSFVPPLLEAEFEALRLAVPPQQQRQVGDLLMMSVRAIMQASEAGIAIGASLEQVRRALLATETIFQDVD